MTDEERDELQNRISELEQRLKNVEETLNNAIRNLEQIDKVYGQ